MEYEVRYDRMWVELSLGLGGSLRRGRSCHDAAAGGININELEIESSLRAREVNLLRKYND